MYSVVLGYCVDDGLDALTWLIDVFLPFFDFVKHFALAIVTLFFFFGITPNHFTHSQSCKIAAVKSLHQR